MSRIIIEYWNSKGDIGNILYQSSEGEIKNRILFPTKIESQKIGYELEEVQEPDVRGIPETVEIIWKKTQSIIYLCDHSLADAFSMLKLHDSIFIKLKGEDYKEIKELDVDIDTDIARLQAEVTLTFTFEYKYNVKCGIELQKPFTRAILSSGDDGYGEPEGTGATAVDNTASLMHVGDSGTKYYSFIRLENILLSRGQAVSYAELQMFMGQDATVDDVRIHAMLAEDVPTAPLTNDDLTAILTTAYVDWSPSSANAGTKIKSPNIKTIIDEIIGQAGWDVGNSILFIIIPDGISQMSFGTIDGGYPTKLMVLSEDIQSDPVWRSYSEDYQIQYD